MDTIKAKYILEIAKHQNITAAAKTLFLSQPYLTKVLQNVEEDLGCQLFHRKRGAMELTDAGKVYIAYLQETLELERSMKQRISDITAPKCGRLAIGTSALRNECFVVEIIKRFHREYPKVQVEIHEQTFRPTLKLLNDGTCDIALLSVFGDMPKLMAEIIGTERLLLVAPTNYYLKHDFPSPKSVINADCIRSVAGEQFVLAGESQSATLAIKSYLRKYNLTLNNILRSQSPNVILSYALNGQCFAFITESFLYKYRNLNPDYYFVDDPLLSMNLAIIYKQRKLSRIEEAFACIARQYASEVLTTP